ncbi:MAG: DUF885 domain-containing protein [Opitutaceae bacterium]|nr:DUF885 domain-containing protein [Opitutaceae bacterium]
MQKFTCCLLAVLAVPLTAAPTPLDRMFADFWEESLAADPVSATFCGDNRYNDRFGPTSSAEAIAGQRRLAETYLAQAAALDPSALGAEERISYDLFRYQHEMTLEGLRYPSHLLPVNQIFSLHLLFAQLGSGQSAQPFATVADYENWIGRARGFGPYVDGIIGDMRTGITRGIVLPKELAAAVIPQLASLGTADLDQSVFLTPVRRLPAEFSAADRERLTAAYTALVRDELAPAYRRLHDFMRDEYLPRCRDTVGWGALPGGTEWYAYLARSYTTTTLAPDEIHRLGLAEVARLRALMEEAKAAVGFRGTLQEFYRHLDTDPSLKFKTREDMQQAYEDLRARVEARVPEFFGRTPRTPFVIRAVESYREQNAAPAQYYPGTPDGQRPGIFYYNAYRPETRSRFTTEAFFVHEAIPGHHFEISLAQEHASLPAFRRFGRTTAYSEGWGLYCEMLGRELGLYTDPHQWVGRLSAEIWRACRLVIDTGIHAKGWTREQAVAYFLEHVPQSEGVARQEVDRYIAYPGQALSYKIGELRLRELRALAERELGPKFSLRAFHDEVLAHGSVPLDVLEAAVRRWIAAQQAA